jgi:hypothetical protein
MTAYCVVKNKNQEESTSLRYLEMIIDKKQKSSFSCGDHLL